MYIITMPDRMLIINIKRLTRLVMGLILLHKKD